MNGAEMDDEHIERVLDEAGERLRGEAPDAVETRLAYSARRRLDDGDGRRRSWWPAGISIGLVAAAIIGIVAFQVAERPAAQVQTPAGTADTVDTLPSVSTSSASPAATSPDITAATVDTSIAPLRPDPAPGCGEVSDALFDEAQFAFVGKVTAVEEVIHPWTTDVENPDRPAVATPMPWVTFDVERWYLRDWGTSFAVWMPGLSVAVGERLAVGGNAYHTEVERFSGQSGEVEFCSPVPGDAASLADWDDRLGSPVVPTAPPASTLPLPATKVFGEFTDPCEPTVLRNATDDPEVLAAGTTCFLAAFDADVPVIWDVQLPTVEGDPIVSRYEFDGATVTITMDHSFDTFGSGAVVEQRCTGVRSTTWLPEGVDCTATTGSGFQADSVQ